ncbi:MAG: glyoxalase superfamily protein [Candidatus Woesearchaeota archaeon]|nr:glyoxalase superfamily protein [Candidatus Woesearchaeota archaeon]
MKTDLFVELHVPEFSTARKFYGNLGFRVKWERDGYLVMQRGASVLNFYLGQNEYFQSKKSDRGHAVEIILLVDGVEAFYEQVKDTVKVVSPLQERKWGVKDFRIVDPFGFYIRISERYEWLESA